MRFGESLATDVSDYSHERNFTQWSKSINFLRCKESSNPVRSSTSQTATSRPLRRDSGKKNCLTGSLVVWLII